MDGDRSLLLDSSWSPENELVAVSGRRGVGTLGSRSSDRMKREVTSPSGGSKRGKAPTGTSHGAGRAGRGWRTGETNAVKVPIGVWLRSTLVPRIWFP